MEIYVVYDSAETVVMGIFTTLEKARTFAAESEDPEDISIYREELDKPHTIGVDNKNLVRSE